MDPSPAALAALHARCFHRPPPWSAAAFAATLSGSGAGLLTRADGFLVFRVVADEAELLTLAVDPERRRAGTGRALVQAFLAEAADRGAARAFLEVASDNAAARALYARTGWTEAGCRRDYYGPGLGAVVMVHRLAAA